MKRRCGRRSPSCGPGRTPRRSWTRPRRSGTTSPSGSGWRSRRRPTGTGRASRTPTRSCEVRVMGLAAPAPRKVAFGQRMGLAADRQLRYLLVWPPVLVLLLIGLFPLVYALIVSFQNITMMDEDTGFQGLVNYI